MNKRSKIALVFLVLFIFMVIVSLNMPSQTHDLEDDIIDFEAEIMNPNNDLSLEDKDAISSDYLLINVANKANSLINRIFNYIISFFQALCEGIFWNRCNLFFLILNLLILFIWYLSFKLLLWYNKRSTRSIGGIDIYDFT